MGATVEGLELEKRELEASNAKTIGENRHLLDELERINGSIEAADGEIASLNATRQSTLEEVERLNALAARASVMEQQLSKLESEHATLQKQVVSKDVSNKAANQRWSEAAPPERLRIQISCGY